MKILLFTSNVLFFLITVLSGLVKCSIFHVILTKSSTLESGVVQFQVCVWNGEWWVAVHDWDEGEVPGDAEELIHSPIDNPEWSLFKIKTTIYEGN